MKSSIEKLERFIVIIERYEPENKKTSGNEFSSGKFYSVASSSRFVVSSFTEKNTKEKLDYIRTIKINGKQELIKVIEFEHDTEVDANLFRTPELDVYFETEDNAENYNNKIYKELEKEVKIIFAVFREKFPNIDFGFCYNGKYNTLKELKSEF